MSLIRRVADLVLDLGSATLDQLAPYLPDHTRNQVKSAMHNAAAVDLIHCRGRMRRQGGSRYGSEPATYYPGPSPTKEPRQKVRPVVIHTRPPASVWELAQSRQQLGPWSPPGAGRKYQLLGPWIEPGQNDNYRSAA